MEPVISCIHVENLQ